MNSLQFVESGSHAAFIYQGQEILRLDKNIGFFNFAYFGRDQVMVPGGKPELAVVPVLSAYFHSELRDVRYDVEYSGDWLRVRIIPVKLGSGDTMLSRWREEDVIGVRLENGRFLWQQDSFLCFFEDVDLDAPDARMRICRTHHADNRPGRFFQFIDPAPAGASGPAVPMSRDWLGYHEPCNGPDTFRQHWKREYVDVIFQDPDGCYSTADLNKTRWSNLTLDNRRSRPCAARGAFYLVKASGQALEYQVDVPSHYHHVCEWGMDFHAWCDLDPFARGSIIPAGTTIACSTLCRLVDEETVAPILKAARRIELTSREHSMADRPAYEEPENSFNVSALERLDAQPWLPTSEGCSWDSQGGHASGFGCLAIKNSYSMVGSWEYNGLGPSLWGNPIIPGSRYRLSAWVRVDDFLPDPSFTLGPQVGVELIQYNGPAAGSTQTVNNYGWSPSLISDRLPLPVKIEWTRIGLITPPVPNYVLRGTLKLRFCGPGTAHFSGVRWEPLD